MKIKVDFLSLEKILEEDYTVFSDVINIDVKNDCAVATDGYVLVVMEDVIVKRTDKVKSKEIILNYNTIKRLKSNITRTTYPELEISEDRNNFKIEMWDANDEVEIKVKKEKDEALKYPDWKSAVPKNKNMLKVAFSVKELKKIIELAEEFKCDVIEFKINKYKKKPSVFELKDKVWGNKEKVWGLIMPCKEVEK